jgi:probable rRNA maturation factor
MSSALSLSVQYIIKPKNIPSRYDFRRWVKAALLTDSLPAMLTVRIVDQDEALTLNQTYRQKPYATNVLTFSFEEQVCQQENLPLLGDIVLCAPVIEQEALLQNKTLFAHYAHLVVHGALHLQGYNHVQDEEARVMEALEKEILGRQGFANPYQSL